MAGTTQRAGESEVAILARVLGNERGELPPDLARYILDLGFSDRDKGRMHDLVVRNRDDGLSAAEKQELSAFGKAGDLLAILKSKARRVLGILSDRDLQWAIERNLLIVETLEGIPRAKIDSTPIDLRLDNVNDVKVWDIWRGDPFMDTRT